MFYFHPNCLGNDPIWRTRIFFQMGLVQFNHQLRLNKPQLHLTNQLWLNVRGDCNLCGSRFFDPCFPWGSGRVHVPQPWETSTCTFGFLGFSLGWSRFYLGWRSFWKKRTQLMCRSGPIFWSGMRCNVVGTFIQHWPVEIYSFWKPRSIASSPTTSSPTKSCPPAGVEGHVEILRICCSSSSSSH